jgi:hypothetical protein
MPIDLNQMNESQIQLNQLNQQPFNMVVTQELNNNNKNNNNQSLSRELSDFLNNNLGCLENSTNQQKLDSERTIDLSAILIQDQTAYRRTIMPISDLLASNQLPTINFDSKSTVKNQDDNSLNTTTTTDYGESESTCDYEEVTTSKKRKAAHIDRSKRLSTTSTTSSSLGENSTGTGRGRGRRGARLNSVLTNESEDVTARFGNKYVQKGTDEYNDRRNKNNDAVKKCRAKLQEKQQEREQRLKELTEENRKLTSTVDSLNKELSVLKGILATMKPQCSLPSEIEEKIKKLESMILANNFNSNIKV